MARPLVFYLLAVASSVVFVLVAFPLGHASSWSHLNQHYDSSSQWGLETRVFNFAIVSDNDKDSRVHDETKNEWQSKFKTGRLTRRGHAGWKLDWDKGEIDLRSKLSEDGRGLELSELAYFNGKLYTCSGCALFLASNNFNSGQ
jgi:hypothetical protein